jgi:hypothetical protein
VLARPPGRDFFYVRPKKFGDSNPKDDKTAGQRLVFGPPARDFPAHWPWKPAISPIRLEIWGDPARPANIRVPIVGEPVRPQVHQSAMIWERADLGGAGGASLMTLTFLSVAPRDDALRAISLSGVAGVSGMSNALQKWADERCAALDSLVDVHGKVTGKRRGRQRATEHLNRALFVALSAEFQGFCRDLHEDAAIHITESINLLPGNAKIASVVLGALVRERSLSVSAKSKKERRLDTGNANVDALATDYSMLGMDLWTDLSNRYPTKTPKWKINLDSLNDVRNGVAHSDAAKLVRTQQEHGLTLATFRKWRSSLNGAVYAMDKVVGAYLLDLTGSEPW